MATFPVCAEQDDHIGSGFGAELEKPITARDYSESRGQWWESSYVCTFSLVKLQATYISEKLNQSQTAVLFIV